VQLAVLVVAIFAAGFALGHHSSVTSAQPIYTMPPELEEDFEPFWQAYNMIQNEYIEAELSKLVDGAVAGSRGLMTSIAVYGRRLSRCSSIRTASSGIGRWCEPMRRPRKSRSSA
jgi:hypothetical protein